jgi:hypothetical protein
LKLVKRSIRGWNSGWSRVQLQPVTLAKMDLGDGGWKLKKLAEAERMVREDIA